MIHRAIRVRGWTVDFLFAHPRNDAEGVTACLLDYGAPGDLARRAQGLMDGAPDCGFTFSNGERRVCLTWIGPQTAGEQWLNTTVHEIVHVATAIALDRGIDPYTERFAYLVGDITQEISDIMCFLSCDHCRDSEK